jgi:hypothetical protein
VPIVGDQKRMDDRSHQGESREDAKQPKPLPQALIDLEISSCLKPESWAPKEEGSAEEVIYLREMQGKFVMTFVTQNN